MLFVQGSAMCGGVEDCALFESYLNYKGYFWNWSWNKPVLFLRAHTKQGVKKEPTNFGEDRNLENKGGCYIKFFSTMLRYGDRGR